MSFANGHQARKKAFSKIDETCPIVEEAFQASMEELQTHIETLMPLLGDEALKVLISTIEISLAKVECTIKKEVTYKMRDELISSCEETLNAEDDASKFESELEDCNNQNKSLESTIESLESSVNSLEKTVSALESDINYLNNCISKLESSDFNETRIAA